MATAAKEPAAQKPDWAALRVEYVNSTITLRGLADKHGIKAAGVMRRAAKEKWEDARKQESAKVSKASQEALSVSRTEELARFNEDDLKVAKGIRSQAARMMGNAVDPSSLRTLASAFESAQRIGRLALGAATDSHDNISSDGSMSPQGRTLSDFYSDDVPAKPGA